MEKSIPELEDLVNSQKEQLSRYEARLKDVVAAYKGLLKEKDALESSLSAVTDSKEKSETKKSDGGILSNDTSTTTTNANIPQNSQSTDLQVQIATLMNSLATLSAEKSRMEASFQADKKKLRNDLIKKDETIGQLKEKVKEYEKQNSVDLENMKSKVIIERHEREKETNNHMVMIRELQKLYADERHLKENLEMQLNDLKTEITSSSTPGSKMKDLTVELKEVKEKLKQYEIDGIKESETSGITFQDSQIILQQLQSEMKHLKQQHSIAIRAEQKRVYVAEERSKKLAALHEDRVANLEARLAELSSTVGTYDQLRQQDQENIQKLKEKISRLASTSKETEMLEDQQKNIKINCKQEQDVQSLYDDIVQLKKNLILENSRSQNPIDLNELFSIHSKDNNDHNNQYHDYNTKQQEEFDQLYKENEQNMKIIAEQKNHIKNLQDKVKVLNRNIDEQEIELKFHADRSTQAVKMEISKWKSNLSNLENEYRGKINDMEEQLQKQRVRSLQLVDEKENEIKALKTSFEIFMPQQQQQIQSNELQSKGEEENFLEGNGKLRRSSASHIHSVLNPNSGNTSNIVIGESCHMIHYANEIARKEVEITGLRKAKYMAESALRQAIQDKITTQEELHDKIDNLEELVDRLERCKTREGANLEYLKNVFISFLSTSNAEGKKHMINAIAAVLQFTPAEAKAINIIMFNK